MTNLVTSMTEAWSRRASEALTFLTHELEAPALFKPDAIERARRDYAHAMREAGRWSA